MGVLDGMNAYDTAILSGGPLHYTLGLCKRANGKRQSALAACVIYQGELCPALSMQQARAPQDFTRFFGIFGLRPLTPWADPPTALYSSAHRKLRGWVTLQDETGAFVDARAQHPGNVPAGQLPNVTDADFQLAEVLHHWHWIYRWQMAPRLSQGLREMTYDLARARLRALLSTPVKGIVGAPAGLTLGDLFTSELSVALLERVHVFNPPWIFDITDQEAEWLGRTVADIKLQTHLQAAFDAAKATGGTDPDDWGDVEEAALAAAMTPSGAGGLADVSTWPAGNLFTFFRHTKEMLPLVLEEAPDIGPIPSIVVAPGEQARQPFAVTDRRDPPGGSHVHRRGGHRGRHPRGRERVPSRRRQRVRARDRRGRDRRRGPGTVTRPTAVSDDPRGDGQRLRDRCPAGGQGGALPAAGADRAEPDEGSFELDTGGLFAAPLE